jgi:amino acid adenylation domain-containing protein
LAPGGPGQVDPTDPATIPVGFNERPDAASGFVQLPTDAQRSTATGYRGAAVNARALRRATGNAAAALAGAVSAVLFRYTQQETLALDVYVREPDSVRRKSVVFQGAVTANEPVSAAVAQAAAALAALRDGASKPHGNAESNVALSVVEAADRRAVALDDSDSYDVHFVFRAEPPQLELVYNTCLFDVGTIERLADAVARVFEVVSERPETPVGRLPVLAPADLRTITIDWDSGHAVYPEEPVHRTFERLAREQPAALAASFEGQTLTYDELDVLSNRLAHHLIAGGITPGDAVAVCVLPSLDIVVAFLSIWKAGAVYVPLDPTHPEALIAVILDEVRPKVVLTQSQLRPLTKPESHAQFCFDTDMHLTADRPATAPARPVTLADPAYVLYTSGTTGKPKGVDARHANLAHYVHVARQMYGFVPDDVFCSLARYTFSISLFELVLPLSCGASVRLLARDDVLAPDRLASTLSQVTVVHAGPSLLGNLFRYLRSKAARPTFPQIRHASSGGDIVPPTLVEEMKHVFENAELFVIYGCTEISCMGCTYPISRDRKMTRTFVGRPFPDVDVRVTDPVGNLVPFGVVGEICFAGKGVVPGYLHRPELTAEKFVDREDRRFYHTGDMGRLHADGNVEILGRRDYQVQLRGIRVELVGIENVVREIGLAEQCVMVVKTLDAHDVRLVAFAVKPRESTIGAFRQALAVHLPDYMLPQALVVVDALPVTRNGKLDRNAVQALPWKAAPTEPPPAAPTTTLERQVAAAFAKALGVGDVGLDADFFDSGGHSLLAVIVAQELENALGLTLPLGLLFEHTTARALARQIRTSLAHEPRPVPLSVARDRPALFMLHGVQLYGALARRLEGQYSVYGVYSGREMLMFESSDTALTVPDLARDYIEIIRRQQPQGPYRIAGISFGGIVAYEVAQQLRAQGEDVPFVGLLDAVLPEAGGRRWTGRLARLHALPCWDIARSLVWRLHRRVAALCGARPKSEFTRYDGDETLAPIEDLRQRAYMRAAAEYVGQLRSFSGSVELIVAGHRLARDPLQRPDCGWHRYVSTVRVRSLPSDHLGLLEEPTVAGVANIFLESMRGTPLAKPA